MSTRSNIGLQYEDGSVYMVYCHSDGYLEHNGLILQRFYSYERQVRKLISKGDISSLSEIDGKAEYYVGKGEPPSEPSFYRNTREAIEDMEEYLYLFRIAEQKWYVSDHGKFMEPLTQEIERVTKNEK